MKILGRLCIMAFSALLLACGTQEPNTLTFAVGGAPNEIACWESITADFTRQTGIPVRIMRQPTSTDQRRQELLLGLKAQEPSPDVFLLDIAWLGQFAAAGWLEPISEIPEDPERAFFARVIRLADRYEGNLVALPIYVDAGLLYYRTDLLARLGHPAPPETWSELVTLSRAAQKLMRPDDARFFGFAWQGAQHEGLVCNFLEFAISHGGGLEDAHGRLRIASPENIAALTLMRDLIREERVSPPNTYTDMREEEVRSFFQEGHSLFERNWPYAYALHQAEASPVKGKVGIAPLPHAPGERSAATLGGWHVGVSRFSRLKPQALAFARHITSLPVQKRLALELGWNPGRVEVYGDSEVLTRYPHFAALRQVFENAAPRPNLPYYAQISEPLQRHLNAALAGGEEPVGALAAAEAEAARVAGLYRE